jgi:sugar phosphate isomerase/epimerase
MRLAGYTYSFATLLDKRQIDTAGIIRFYGELGVKGVEITGGYVREGEFPAVQKALAETGMAVACYDLVCDVVTADRAERQARVARLHADLRQAAGLGAKTALVIPGPPREGVAHAAARQWFSEALRDSLAEAARLDVTLTVANVGWQPVVYGTSEQILGICAAAGPGLKVTYDVGNFLLAGEDNLHALEREAPLLAHVHFKDWKVVPSPSPHAFPGVDGQLYLGEVLGKGVLNLAAAAARLRQLGYAGWISVEYEGVDEPREAARHGGEYLRSLLEGAAAGAGSGSDR